MTVLNKDSSSSTTCSDSESQFKRPTVYERILLIYSRDDDRFINRRNFHDCEELDLGDMLSFLTSSRKEGNSDRAIKKYEFGNKCIWETERQNQWTGVVTEDFEETKFESWFIELIINQSRIQFTQAPSIGFEIYTNVIADKFAHEIKNTIDGDKWDLVGKSSFKKSVNFFTSKWQTLEAVLPAFPCKSSNFEKVAGTMPDKGEELALRKLIRFSESIRRVYPPGIIIWIVSDGHVFSDCIAVDDNIVNEYGRALKELYLRIKPEDSNPVRFCSLPEIFSLESSNFLEDTLEDVELGHYLPTIIDDESELCRKILVTACDTDSGKLREDIKTDNHPRLHLFRGFSKFMTEDLANHPKISDISKKKFKKIVANVAFEMIKRNDAYSNLVELVFPFHLRFSIHAHNNAGPKFGIQLLSVQGPNKCQAINSIGDHMAPSTTDLLHIPTPWHNSVVTIDDNDTYYIIKASKVLSELKSGRGTGGWDSKRLHYYFFSH
ncbi:Pyoverdine/dityrosine biosynthesis protein-domain-containing protein [Scheffersomyces xylosifermentans]|uniref:Pyoverdine/dityrosine biosynthesis protein-domain-containing protein n=1 Tax=Scheffersomyces xylosifermentans TaxID=1304137 RepID=UPI00315D52DB